ncbi:MAG: type II toxin-antitoxin system RelB/DinJ family antitoxin, partial [Methanocorpusculum sp.]|nr:type II toxin-antitoxin system RelB/DinJ family antitoxin [Methanocorpusculum sp.]
MTKTATLSIRVDTETKDKAEAICSSLGMPLSGAVNVFL